MPPARALSLLNPKLVFSEAQAAAGVQEGVLGGWAAAQPLQPQTTAGVVCGVMGGGVM
jgi:hypothetical protein